MNSIVVSCVSASLLLYLGAVSYHMHYLQESITLFYRAKQRYYLTDSLLVHGIRYYKKNRTQLQLPDTRIVPCAVANAKFRAVITIAPLDPLDTGRSEENRVEIKAQLHQGTQIAAEHRCIITQALDKQRITDWQAR